MNYTDTQLKQALAKMLPEQIVFREFIHIWGEYGFLYWKNKNQHPLQSEVRDTELLHLCWMVEENLDNKLNLNYYNLIEIDPHASWQQRVKALAEVKGIEI